MSLMGQLAVDVCSDGDASDAALVIGLRHSEELRDEPVVDFASVLGLANRILQLLSGHGCDQLLGWTVVFGCRAVHRHSPFLFGI